VKDLDFNQVASLETCVAVLMRRLGDIRGGATVWVCFGGWCLLCMMLRMGVRLASGLCGFIGALVSMVELGEV